MGCKMASRRAQKSKLSQIQVETESPFKDSKLEVFKYFEVLINALMKRREDLLAQIQELESEYLDRNKLKLGLDERKLESPNVNEVAFRHGETNMLIREIEKLGEITKVKELYSQKVKPVKCFGRTRADEKLCRPRGVTVDKERIYVSDTANSRVQVFSAEGEYISEFGRPDLTAPHSLSVQDSGVFVTDWGVQRVLKFNSQDFALVASSEQGKLDNPRGLASDESGDVYVANGNKISIFTQQLEMQREVGEGKLKFPQDIKIEGHKLYVADRDTLNIHVFSMQGEVLENAIELEYGCELLFFCLDKYCNIILSDNAGKCIQIFAKKGKHLHTIKMDRDSPRGIAIDRDNNIVCVKENSYQIYIY